MSVSHFWGVKMKFACYETWKENKRGENVESAQLWPGLHGSNRKASSAHLKGRGSDRASPAACCWHNGGRSPADTPGRSNLHTEITHSPALGATTTTTDQKLAFSNCSAPSVRLGCWNGTAPMGMKSGWRRWPALGSGSLPRDTLNVLLQSAVGGWESEVKVNNVVFDLWWVKKNFSDPFLSCSSVSSKILPNS